MNWGMRRLERALKLGCVQSQEEAIDKMQKCFVNNCIPQLKVYSPRDCDDKTDCYNFYNSYQIRDDN